MIRFIMPQTSNVTLVCAAFATSFLSGDILAADNSVRFPLAEAGDTVVQVAAYDDDKMLVLVDKASHSLNLSVVDSGSSVARDPIKWLHKGDEAVSFGALAARSRGRVMVAWSSDFAPNSDSVQSNICILNLEPFDPTLDWCWTGGSTYRSKLAISGASLNPRWGQQHEPEVMVSGPSVTRVRSGDSWVLKSGSWSAEMIIGQAYDTFPSPDQAHASGGYFGDSKALISCWTGGWAAPKAPVPNLYVESEPLIGGYIRRIEKRLGSCDPDAPASFVALSSERFAAVWQFDGRTRIVSLDVDQKAPIEYDAPFGSEKIAGLASDHAGNLFVAAEQPMFESDPHDSRYVLYRFDAAGRVSWQMRLCRSAVEIRTIFAQGDESLIVAGNRKVGPNALAFPWMERITVSQETQNDNCDE